jgi:hypothetical protein
MTKRNPVSAVQNIWFDAEQVTAENLNVEQSYNNSIQSGIINNHIGTGILSDSLEDRVLFNSDNVNGLLDGVIVTSQQQPSDNNYGNQLEISLERSKAAGKRAVKVCIIGLDFQSNLQYETFYFKVNESQFTKKHYTSILQILINDLRGESAKSFNLGGTLIIKESKPYSLSRSTSMISQMFQPNLFFRDFYTAPTYNNSVLTLLRAGLPYYNIDNLNIKIGQLNSAGKTLGAGDVTTQIGQKFKATTNNIQKITLLLSSSDPASNPDDYKWNGEIVVSIYPLQTALQCPTDIPPSTLIGYSPSPVPLAQISFNYDSLLASGIQLDTVPQPVDFIFSNTSVGSGSSIVSGNYYAFTIKRSGAADVGEIYISSGVKFLSSEESRLTVFNGVGGIWVDLTEEDLWFNVHTDAAKVTDGQAYVSGNGVTLPKVVVDQTTGITTDYCLDNLYFSGNDIFKGVIFAETDKNTPTQDLRTGNLVYSRQQNYPDVQLLGTLDINKLEQTIDPLLIGSITDKNVKKYSDIGSGSAYSLKLYTSSIVNNEIFIKVINNQNDPRYDNNNTQFLQTQLLTGNLTKIKVYPDFANSPDIYYRVSAAEQITLKYGDLNFDGVVDQDDANLLQTYLGFDFNHTPPLESTFSIDIVHNTATFVNGYLSYEGPFTSSGGPNLSFYVVDSNTNAIITLASGNDGSLIPHPEDPRIGLLSSVAINFTSLANQSVPIAGNKLLILNPGDKVNKGGFEIIGIDINDNLIIRKIILNSDSILSLFSADLNNDYVITNSDKDYLNKYVDKSGFVPPVSAINNKIGTSFQVIKLSLEKYEAKSLLDRNDDYYPSIATRNSDIHLIGTPFKDDLLIQNINIGSNPATIRFERQFNWEDYLVVANTENKLVPAIFDNKEDTVVYSHNLDGIIVESYNKKTDFDPGRVDQFIPDNLIIGHGGEIVRENGDFYKVDFEVGIISIEIPTIMTGADRSISIFDDFIADYDGYGLTKFGYPAMRFADGSTVKQSALDNNQVRFSASVQSYSPSLDGVAPNNQKGTIVDGRMGVYLDYKNGVITLNFTNLYKDVVLPTRTTRVQVHVFLKKGGFNNFPLEITDTQTSNLMKIINIFSGPIVGGASALVDLEKDVFNILPVANGGTGLSVRINNPLYVYGVSGLQTTNASDTIVGALTFRFDKIVLEDIKDIRFEAIISTSNANSSSIKLYDYTTATDIVEFPTYSMFPTLVVSNNLLSQLNTAAFDNMYYIKLSAPLAGTANCYMARLVVTYNHVAEPT